MRGATELPLGFDEITTKWLGEALSAAHPGVEVASVEIDRVIHGTASKALLRLTYNDARLPPTVCVKGGFRDALRKRERKDEFLARDDSDRAMSA
jgi:hypothetical protein